MKVRTAIMSSYDFPHFLYKWKEGPLRKLYNAFTLIGYILQTKRTSRRTTKVNVDDLVSKWVPVVTQLSNAHDKDEFDNAEAQIDTLLTPLLTAPIKQVREFYTKLLKELKTNKKIPMLIWMSFETWGEVMVKDAPDEKIKRLKTKLAREIADLVEEDIKPQIATAITRALRWRDPEQLEAVKENLEKGIKPQLKGRESCLFLEVGKGKKKTTVML